MVRDYPQNDVQDGAERLRLALQVPAQPLGHREHPLAYRQRRKDMIGQVRGALRHAPRIARRTEANQPLWG